ncbi:MAG: hypothetical protein LBG60_02870 [Bifidobacteriaceae bacterium]|nr:hypothetical protein [Bifidobacteriaceae bacterium]
MDQIRTPAPAAGERDRLAAELRNWAEGTYRAKAAVALLLNAVRGRLAYRGAPWIEQLGTDQAGKSHARIDPAKLVSGTLPLSSGERLVAKVVANLLDSETLVPLADLSRLDTGEARIVLGALAQAAGFRPAAPKPRPAPAPTPAPPFARPTRPPTLSM